MSFFNKMFSGKNRDKENRESDYLKKAYDSLGDESHLNPDKILDENSEIVLNEFTEAAFDSDTAENLGGDFGVELKDFTDGENIYDEVLESAAGNIFNKNMDLDDGAEEAKASDFRIGDTGEMDADEIDRAVNFTSAYVLESNLNEDSNLGYGQEFEAVSIDNKENKEATEDNDKTADTSDTLNINGIDKELLYSAYAPKSMRPKVTETAYYDLDDIEDYVSEPEESRFKAFVKKRKGWIIGAGAAAAVVLVVLGSIFLIQHRMNPLMGYSEVYVSKGNVIKTMSAGGNVEPNARYNITSLVSGTVTESPLNAGEAVKAGELVYKIDDTNAQLAVQQAENAVKRAEVTDTSSSSSEQLKIYANATGTISGLNISAGSMITGGQIAVITQANGTEIGLIPSVTGTVQSVNVRNGSSVTSGQVIATLKSNQGSTSAQGRELDLAASKLVLEQAQKDLEKYKIASPIDGTILIKNAKIGDNVGTNQNGEPLMVIADMSKMKFTIEVDELDIWNINLGQTVVITANALPGETFSGEITNIAGEGEKKGNGVTVYAVEITIADPGKIKSGMNVDAKIILNSAINVLTLPNGALYESDGTNALVITDSNSIEEEAEVDTSEYPDIYVPKGYKLAKIKYGLSDGTNTEILSGLRISDRVLYLEDDESDHSVQPAREDDSSNSNDSAGGADDNGENIKSTGKSATQDWFSDLE